MPYYDGARAIEGDEPPTWRELYVQVGVHANCPACNSELHVGAIERADSHSIYIDVACSNEHCGWTGQEVYRLIDVQ